MIQERVKQIAGGHTHSQYHKELVNVVTDVIARFQNSLKPNRNVQELTACI